MPFEDPRKLIEGSEEGNQQRTREGRQERKSERRQEGKQEGKREAKQKSKYERKHGSKHESKQEGKEEDRERQKGRKQKTKNDDEITHRPPKYEVAEAYYRKASDDEDADSDLRDVLASLRFPLLIWFLYDQNYSTWYTQLRSGI